jgi:hypothetical protein
MKEKIWMGMFALVLSAPSLAQSVEELKRRLADQEAENRQLRERITILEREVTPNRVENTRRGRPSIDPEDEDESNRALERALVREGGMVLSPGTFELEPNFAYSSRNDNFSQTRRQSFGPALVFRAGLPWRSQIEASLPYVFERRRDSTVSNNSHGVGDFAVGLSHQIMNERPFAPALIGAIQYQASTGKNTIFESGNSVALGSGFDSIQGSLTAVKRIDPLVVFGNYSVTHIFPQRKEVGEVDLGNSQTLRLGTALATGPDTSLRSALNVTFFEKTKFGGKSLSGTDDPLGMLELGGSVVVTNSTAVDVQLGIGLTSNAPDFRITVALPIRF